MSGAHVTGRITYGVAVVLHGAAGLVVVGVSIAVATAGGQLGWFWATVFVAVPAVIWGVAMLALAGLRGGRAGYLWGILPLSWALILLLEVIIVVITAFSYG